MCIRDRTLTLLEKLNELDADEQADICESLHDPVSYTHLDVYKRQTLGRSAAASGLSFLTNANPVIHRPRG